MKEIDEVAKEINRKEESRHHHHPTRPEKCLCWNETENSDTRREVYIEGN
jgi:hypothetical protein